jgi:polysaccharide pyruvyl transferase CsaB
MGLRCFLKKTNTILIAGYYGFENIGDEALLTVVLNELRSKITTPLDITVISGAPEITSKSYQVRSIHWTDITKIIQYANECDVIVLGGGGLFHDYQKVDLSTLVTSNHTGITYAGTFPTLAYLFNKPIILYGVGVGPLFSQEAKDLTKFSFEAASVRTVRDQVSKDLLNSLGVEDITITADPAFLLSADTDRGKKILQEHGVYTDRLVLGVCVRPWESTEPGVDWKAEIARALDEIAEEKDVSVIFIPFQSQPNYPNVDDVGISKEIIRQMEHKSISTLIEGEYNPHEIAGVISQCDLVIGMRLHSLIFAARNKVPFVAIQYDPKISGVLEQLELTSYSSTVDQVNHTTLVGKINKILSESLLIKNHLIERVGGIIKQAEENTRLAADCIANLPAKDLNHEETEFLRSFALDKVQQLAISQNELADQRIISAALSTQNKMLRQPVKLFSMDRKHKPDIICFSIIDWTFRYQRPQQLMTQFAENGHRVFYISISQKLAAEEGAKVAVHYIKDNIFEVTLLSKLDLDVYNYVAEPSEENFHIQMISLQELKDVFNIENAICYVMIASWINTALEARRRWEWPIVYDCMDEWDKFPLISQKLLTAEKKLAAVSDLIVVTSGLLYEKFKMANSSIVLARNGSDFNFFESNCIQNDLLKDLSHPIIGYYGALAEWFDVDLVRFAAEKRPDYNFVLIGGVHDLDVTSLKQMPNVHLLGLKPYVDMPKYLYHFDVCIIPFLVNPITEATDPVKLYEFFSAGKPVVSVNLNEVNLYKEFLYLSKSREEFVDLLDKAVKEDNSELREKRIIVAKNNSWSSRYSAIMKKMPSTEKRKTLRAIRRFVAPDNSFRQRVLDTARRWFSVLRRDGLRKFSTKVWGKLKELLFQKFYQLLETELIPQPFRNQWLLKLFRNGSLILSNPKVVKVLADIEAQEIQSKANTDIIIFSVINWDFRLQRPQQLALRFAENGHRIFYLRAGFKPLDHPEVKRIEKNIFEIYLPGPETLDIYRHVIDETGVQTVMDAFLTLRAEFNINEAVSMVDLPFWGPAAIRLREIYQWKVVYDCMDDHSGFSTNSSEMISNEDELITNSDLVIASSNLLFDRLTQRNKHTILVPNGTDFNHFSVPAEKAKEYARYKSPVVGYYGAISDWFDTELVAWLARQRPEWSFVLIGSTAGASIQDLDNLPNVHLLGEKPYQTLPHYLSGFDVCFIPFKKLPLTEATNPVKLFEFFSAGKTVISTNLHEISLYAEYVNLASSKEEWLQLLECSLAQPADSATVKKRKEFAQQNTWKARASQIEENLSAIYPKVSILLVTYNNLDYTRLCLQSIFKKTDYPNYEIIIVDNDSKDSTPEFLKTLAEQHSNIKVILNDSNRGFAAANNQAAEISVGDYLLFLNNDTIVSRGWIGRMMRHLLRDPSIGLVGPVTNSIGNEAKIDVPYEIPEQMDEFAARRGKEFDGIAFEIKTLALFCTLISKSLYEEIDGLDERYGIGMFEDDDLAMKVRKAGYRLVCAEDAFIHHFHSASFKLLDDARYQEILNTNRKKYEEKWGVKWEPHKYR